MLRSILLPPKIDNDFYGTVQWRTWHFFSSPSFLDCTFSSPCSAFTRFLFFFSLCLFNVQLLLLNTYQKMINEFGWLDDRHGLSPILYDTAPLFVYIDQLLCHCVFICSNVRQRLAYCMRLLLWCFCLLAESYETINHYHYQTITITWEQILFTAVFFH